MKMPNWKQIVLVGFIILFIVSLLFWGAGAPPVAAPSPSDQTASSTGAGTSTTTPASAPVSPSASPQNTAPTLVAPNAQRSNISITAPVTGDKWVTGTNNVIRWSKAAGIAGGLYLANASDGSLVGWIIQQLNPTDTSYQWDTRNVFVSRTSPASKAVTAGNYIIKALFDGVKQETYASSGSFSIIYPNQVTTNTYTLTIQNYAFTPSAITVKKGDKLVFENKDSVAQTLQLSSFSPITIQPGASYTFDTSVFQPASSYTLYSNTYPTLRATVTVQ
ncbi:MAG TPA: hypothetical protein VNG29_02685 [Candidatus Paceibacterota bacterium]|nr:hypothetical protein [Candidatus Paceibacterota bacterium]